MLSPEKAVKRTTRSGIPLTYADLMMNLSENEIYHTNDHFTRKTMINLDFEVRNCSTNPYQLVNVLFFINMNLGIQQFALLLYGIPITSIMKFRSVLLTSVVCFFVIILWNLKSRFGKIWPNKIWWSITAVLVDRRFIGPAKYHPDWSRARNGYSLLY